MRQHALYASGEVISWLAIRTTLQHEIDVHQNEDRLSIMKIEFNLIENAHDSLDRAFELIVWGDQQYEARRLKQAVQAVAHAIELLLKERLRRLHPSLIWENVDQYPNLNARTVGAERAAERLKSIGAVDFHRDDLQLLRELRATRNAIEHFAWVTTKQEADSILGRSLEFAFHFASEQLSFNYLDYGQYKDGTYQELLMSNPDFGHAVERRKKNCSPSNSPELLVCVVCRAKAVDSAARVCKLCGYLESELQGREQYDDDVPF